MPDALMGLGTRELALVDHGWSAYVVSKSVDARVTAEYLRTREVFQHAWAEGFEHGVGQAVGVEELDAARNATIRRSSENSELRHTVVEQLNRAAGTLGVEKLDPHRAEPREIQHLAALLGTRHYMATQRVEALESALLSIAEYWNGHKEHGAMENALEYIVTTARAAVSAGERREAPIGV